MRIVHIDNYEVCEENGKFLAASFVDYEGISHTIELTNELEEYLKEVRKEEFREKYRTNKPNNTGFSKRKETCKRRNGAGKYSRKSTCHGSKKGRNSRKQRWRCLWIF